MDNFDKELKELAKKSKVKPSENLIEKVNITCRSAKKNHKFAKRFAATAAIGTILVFTFGVSFPAYAEQLPVVGSVVKYFNETLRISGYEENLENINFSVEAGDYTITIEDIYYDDIEINIFYKVTSKEPLDPNYLYYFTGELKTKGNLQTEGTIETGGLIDNNTYAGMFTYNIAPNGEYFNQPKSLKADLIINGLFKQINNSFTLESNKGDLEHTKVENCSNTLKLSLQNNSKVEKYDINKEISYNGFTRKLIDIKKYPARIILSENIDNSKSNIDDTTHNEIRYILWDSQKGSLGPKIVSAPSENTWNSQYYSSSENGDLSIIPVFIKYKDTSNLNSPYEFEKHFIEENKKYNFGAAGSVTIEKIQQQDNNTLITIVRDGLQSYFNDFQLKSLEGKKYFSSISRKTQEVLGDLKIRETFVFPKLEENDKYYFENNDELIDTVKVLYDQKINLD